ncbi:MAG: phytoene desaturase family protein [Candidatus Hodarchaeota archaeon]
MTNDFGCLEHSYDIIIIGAGIGGLTCGCYLAKAGMKVLIVEQHNKPGGCCTSFKRNGVSFDSSVHLLTCCSNGNKIGIILDELDLRDKIKFIRRDPTDTVITNDYEISFSIDWNKNIETFCTIFPREVNNIRNFFRYINSVSRKNYQKYLKLGNICFKDMLQNYFNFTDKDLISLISVLLFYSGIPVSEASALICIFAYKQLMDGGYYPIGGMQRFSDAFAKRFREYGGRLILYNIVEQIEIENGEVKGIRLKDNEYVQAKIVISNSDARHTFFKLVGYEHLSISFLNKIKRLQTAPSLFTIYLALNRSLLGKYRSNGVIWYFPGGDIDKFYSEVYYGHEPYLKKGMICVQNPKLDRVLNNNTHDLLYICSPANYNNHRFWEKNRERIADELIERAENIFHDFSSSIVIKLTSTPNTIEKYTLNYRGATNGWACTPQQVSFPVIKSRTRIKGLYMVGHWVNQAFGGGVATVAYMGRNIANNLLYI